MAGREWVSLLLLERTNLVANVLKNQEFVGPELKILYPENKDESQSLSEVDIIFIHGIRAVADSTCTHKATGVNWLRDRSMLPAAVPRARIMRFAYESDWLGKGKIDQGLPNIAARLLSSLRGLRKSCANRPIVFIGHCFGGLVIQQALKLAKIESESGKDLLDCTAGVLFLGTPLRGTDAQKIVALIATAAALTDLGRYSDILKALEPDNEMLNLLLQEFVVVAKEAQIPLACFFEQKPSDLARVLPWLQGIIKKEGLVVKESQACIDGVDRYGLGKNHFQMNKFSSSEDVDYCCIRQVIIDFVEKALNRVEKISNVNQITLVPYLGNTKFHGRERQILDIYQFFTTKSEVSRCQRRLVLQGFPGIGKTTIALQYSIVYRNLYEGVFWVTALQGDTIEREYAKLDDEVKKRTSLSFRDWCTNKKWLLIIDNLDDSTWFHAQSMIPAGQGDVIITSRRTDLNQIGTVIEIPPLTDKTAADLLLLYAENRRPEEEDEDNSLKVARMLGCVPLAIRHCGCLLSEQRSKLSSYIREFDDLMTELAIPEELNQNGSRGAFDLNESKPLLGSFDISFTYLERDSQDAAAMLSLMANLEPTDISVEMLERSLQPHKRWDEDGNINISFVPGMSEWLKNLPSQVRGRGLREVLKTLVKYSLLFPKIEEGYYFLHPLTHFWLRWKQENAKSIEPFTDSLALLYNGFPHPELSRTYGLSSRHQDLRETYIPHVQHLLRRYRRLQNLVDEDESLLLRMATLFLHASDTPEELRPMKQRVRVNVPGTDRALPGGRLVDPFEQDVTFLEVLRDILVRLQYPVTLFLHAIYVFFEHICKEWLASHPRSAFRVQDIEFAGKSLAQIRARILEQSQEFFVTESDGLGSFDAVQNSGVEDLKTLMPLIADTEEHSIVKMNLHKQTGIIGLIALKYIRHVRESVFEAGPRIEVDPVTHAILLIVDDRAWVAEFVAICWTRHFKSLLSSKTERFCDLLKFSHCQLALQAYQAKNDTGNLYHDLPDLRRWSINATIELARLLGPESVIGAESLFMLMWDGTNSYPPQTWVRDVDVANALNTPISSDNYYFKIKIIDAWQHSMRARDMLKEAETLILTWLDKFLDCDSSLTSQWNFGLDPVLDLYEFAIFLFLDWAKDPEKASQFQERYLNYFEKEYGTLFERLCLGCGVGVFGLRHARLRISTPRPQHRQSPEEYAHEMELFLKLKVKLGAAGTSLPNNNPETSRLAEQEWCACRRRAYMEAIGRHIPSTSVSFGIASWNAIYPSEPTVDDTLFQAEANKVKILVWEAIKDGQPDLLAVPSTSTDPKQGPVVSSDAAIASVTYPGEQSNSRIPPLQGSSEQKMGAESTSRDAKQRRTNRFLQRTHISRKGKERLN